MRKIVLCLSIVIILSTIGCDRKESQVLRPTFSSISRLIFSKKCALYTCHSAAYSKESADLDLMDTTAYYNLVNVKSKTYPDILRVKPGDPDNSLVIQRLDGTTVVAVPLERTSISEDEIRVIRRWIKNGALNN